MTYQLTAQIPMDLYSVIAQDCPQAVHVQPSQCPDQAQLVISLPLEVQWQPVLFILIEQVNALARDHTHQCFAVF